MHRPVWPYAALAFCLFLSAWLVIACDDSDGGPTSGSVTPEQQVAVTQDSSPVATFPDQVKAAERASELAGFEVLPVEALPGGFHVVGFNVIPAAAAGSPVRTVQVLIESSSGGLLITQLSSRAQLGSVDPIKSP
ncbi:MAG TPA: hypothetical protein VFY90_14955, partial [Tepidiformaceae bacterium]|nr:hypothetical protein [Tepidiformaceae bacterium]